MATDTEPLLSKPKFNIYDLLIPDQLPMIYDIDVNKYSQSFIEKIYVKFLFKALDSPIDKYDYVFKYNENGFDENIYLLSGERYRKNKWLSYNNKDYVIIYSQEQIEISEKQKPYKRLFILKIQKIIDEINLVKSNFCVKYIINYNERHKINDLMKSIIDNPLNQLEYIQQMRGYIQINVIKIINSRKEYLSSSQLRDILTFDYNINLFREVYYNKPIINPYTGTEYDLVKYLFMLYIKYDLINSNKNQIMI
jgi:hypothetical protein